MAILLEFGSVIAIHAADGVAKVVRAGRESIKSYRRAKCNVLKWPLKKARAEEMLLLKREVPSR